MTGTGDLAERIRAAYERADLDAFGELLADDVRWGDDDNPRRCRGRADVLRTFSQLLESGVNADVVEVDTGPSGVLCRLHVHWPEPADRSRGTDLVHVFLVRDRRVTEIRRYDDIPSAAEAIGAA